MHPLHSVGSAQPVHAAPSRCSKLISRHSQTFNQIQMRFRDQADATTFITELCRFCPCKEETANARATSVMGPPAAPSRPALTRMSSVTQDSSPSAPSQSTANPDLSSLSRAASSHASFSVDASSASVYHTPVAQEHSNVANRVQSNPPVPQTPLIAYPSYAMTPPQTLPSSSSVPSPASTLVSPSASTLLPSLTASDTKVKTALLENLQQVPDLYQLSSSDLELAVGQIVREQGFLEFVREHTSRATHRY